MSMKTYHKLAKPHQRDKARSDQVKNDAGGYVFRLKPLDQLNRFLILGSESGTYYASAHKMTLRGARIVNHCWDTEPLETAKLIKAVSVEGLSPKIDPVLFALVLGASHKSERARACALNIVNDICRTASQLFSFLSGVSEHRGWGRALKRTINQWYLTKSHDDLAYQLIKYRQREGFTHKRAIELSHPRVGDDDKLGAMLRWARGREVDEAKLSKRIQAFILANEFDTPKNRVCELIDIHNLPWECVPTEYRKDKDVMRVLLDRMPLGARLRQLGLMTNLGILKRDDVKVFLDEYKLKRARIHPYNILVALKTYESGQGYRSKWQPEGFVVEILNDAFYLAFKAIEPTGKRILVGLDVSGSMAWPESRIHNTPITAAEGAAAMCMATLRAEDEVTIMAFSDDFIPTKIHRRMSLEEVTRYTANLSFGRTDCSLPMVFAFRNKIPVDAFVVYTDNETWFGGIHPFEALQRYRRRVNSDAKMIVVGMTSTGFTIADPTDNGMLDLVGFDSSAPALISNFISGRI